LGGAGSTLEIDRNLLNFGVKLGTSLRGSRAEEEVKEEIHFEGIGSRIGRALRMEG